MKVKRLCWLGTRTEAFDETTAFFRDVLGHVAPLRGARLRDVRSFPAPTVTTSRCSAPIAPDARAFVHDRSRRRPARRRHRRGARGARGGRSRADRRDPVAGDAWTGTAGSTSAARTGTSTRSCEGSSALAALGADDLDEPAPVALAVELEEEHALPLAEASSPSRTGIDSPAGPRSIDMQWEWPLPTSMSSSQTFSVRRSQSSCA